MFSIFPPLLAFNGFSALLLRLVLGFVYIIWARKEFNNREENSDSSNKKLLLALFEAVIGIALIVGFITQVAALASTIFFGIKLIRKIRAKSFLTNGVNYYLILLIISISLIFSGAGFIAFDLPL